jgi:hypothetical protein
MFLLFFMTALITVGLTAFWPLLISPTKDLGFLRGDRSRLRLFFTYAWAIAAFIVLVLTCGALSHIICASLEWPTISRLERGGDCYFLETAGLGMFQRSSRRPSEWIAGDLALRPASLKLTGVSAEFELGCETSVYQAGDVIWKIVPPARISCEPVVAYEISAIESFRQTRCTGGTWKPSGPEGTKPGFTFNIPYEGISDDPCGVGDTGRLSYRIWVSVKIDESRTWEKCPKVDGYCQPAKNRYASPLSG